MTRHRAYELARRLPGASLLLALPALVIAQAPSLAERLQYERAAVEAGQLWRLVTSHWTHWSGEHLAWDVLVFVALGAACETLGRGRFLLAVLVAALLISLGIWVFLPELATYRGLSGLDAALFLLLTGSLRQQPSLDRWVRIALSLAPGLLLAKVGYEVAVGSTLFVQSVAADVVVVPLAHLLGGAVGWLAGAMAATGQKWTDAIERAIGGCKAVIALLSADGSSATGAD